MDRNLLILAAILLSAVSSANCGKATKILPSDYLIWPKIDFDKNDFHATIRNALKRLVAEERFYEQDPEGALETLASASRKGKFTPEERDTFSKIYRLRDNNNCGREQLDTLQSLWFQMKNGMLPAILERAIEHVSGFSIWYCSLERPQTKWTIDADIERQLDAAFAAALGLENVNSVQLGSRLQRFDLASDKFNAKQMVTIMREHSSSTEAIAEPFDLLSKFMLDRCARFDESLKVTIAVMDLIRAFGSKAVWEAADLIRMDEYNRLCEALKSAEKKVAIRDNLARQLARKEPKEVLAGMLHKLRS